jgi:uncharacterized OsmC-like protein
MTTPELATALRRVQTVLERRPDMGMQDDAPATACWQGGTRIVAGHPGGLQVLTDLPTEMGGSGDQVSPGWLVRAGLASCLSTSILLSAATEGIALDMLQVQASSRSDTRGIFGMAGADGCPVNPAAQDIQLTVRIAARDVDADRLRALVEASRRCSPVPVGLAHAAPIELRVDVVTA